MTGPETHQLHEDNMGRPLIIHAAAVKARSISIIRPTTSGFDNQLYAFAISPATPQNAIDVEGSNTVTIKT